MSIKEHVYKDRILFFIIFLIVSAFLLIETKIKIEDLYKEKIYDVNVQYQSRLISFSYNMEDLFMSIITNDIKELIAKVQYVNSEEEDNVIRG